MVAPIDSKVTFEVEGEAITLRLNFRALALAKKEGIDMMSGKPLDAIDSAKAIRCLALHDHPAMTEEEAFAIVVKGGDAAGEAITRLFVDFGGKASAEGNVQKLRAKR